MNARLIAVGLFAIAMLPLAATPVLPLIDLYNHMSRFYVLAHLGSSPFLPAYYQADWGLMPDVSLDAIAALLLRFVPALVAGHVIVIAVLAVLYSGVLYFHHMLTGQRSLLVAALLLPLLYSYILNWGFINFLLGLGLCFWGAGWWIAQRHRPLFAMPVSCFLAVLIFLTHGFAFVLYGVLTASLEIAYFANDPARKPGRLGKSLLLLAGQAVIPILLFLLWKIETSAAGMLSAHSADLPPAVPASPPARSEYPGLRRLSTIFRVEEGPSAWLDLATFVSQLVIGGFLVWRRQISIARTAWIPIAAGILLIGLTPQNMFGVQYVADRLPLFVGCCLLGSICLSPVGWVRESRIAAGLLLAIIFLRLVLITVDWSAYGGRYDEYRSVAAKIPPGSLTIGLPVGAGRHETGIPRCEMYGSLAIAQFNQIGPTFSTAGQHPLLLKGGLKRAVDIMERDPATRWEVVMDYGAYLKAAASAGIEYILVCNASLLKDAYPSDLTVVDRTPNFLLLRAPKQ